MSMLFPGVCATEWQWVIALFQSFDCWFLTGPLGVAQG